MRLLLVVAFCNLTSVVNAADPVLGTWKLNLEKSIVVPEIWTRQ